VKDLYWITVAGIQINNDRQIRQPAAKPNQAQNIFRANDADVRQPLRRRTAKVK